jgi:hypothetical protein
MGCRNVGARHVQGEHTGYCLFDFRTGNSERQVYEIQVLRSKRRVMDQWGERMLDRIPEEGDHARAGVDRNFCVPVGRIHEGGV